MFSVVHPFFAGETVETPQAHNSIAEGSGYDNLPYIVGDVEIEIVRPAADFAGLSLPCHGSSIVLCVKCIAVCQELYFLIGIALAWLIAKCYIENHESPTVAGKSSRSNVEAH